MENTIRGSFSENQAAEIKLPATECLKFVKSLGAGKAARVELMKNKKGRVFAEKHFTNGSILTRWTYKLAFQAPLPYRTNINAVATAYYTRKVVRDLTVAWFGTPRVADALYIRWDNKNVGWVLGTEYIKGRGPDPVLRNSKYEISELMAFMDKLMDHLYEAGLYGPMWQADKGLSVPTSNFLLDENENWIWIDLESAVPGLRFVKPKPYLKDARQKGFIPLFGDIDFEKLSNYLEKNQDLLLKYPSLQTTVKKLQAHMRAWKESEISIFRNRARNKPRFFHEDKLKRNVTNQYLGAWKHEYEITRKVENRVRNSIWQLLFFLFFADLRYLVANENYRGRWIESKYFKMELKRRIPIGYRKKLLRNYILGKFLFKELHLWLIESKERKKNNGFGAFYIEKKLQEWESLGRLTAEENANLRRGLKESSAYIRGFGYHLFLKPFSLYFNAVSIGGVLITGTLEPLLIMLIMPAMRGLAAIILYIQERVKGNKIRIATALCISPMPKVGIMGFPTQMLHRQPEIFWLISNSTLSGMGVRVPIFGEINSTIEHWFIRRNPVKLRLRKPSKTT